MVQNAQSTTIHRWAAQQTMGELLQWWMAKLADARGGQAQCLARPAVHQFLAHCWHSGPKVHPDTAQILLRPPPAWEFGPSTPPLGHLQCTNGPATLGTVLAARDRTGFAGGGAC